MQSIIKPLRISEFILLRYYGRYISEKFAGKPKLSMKTTADPKIKMYSKRKAVTNIYNPQLDTFLRVADAGSFNKAAVSAYITPTAVIKQINLLEDNLDVKLFERTHRGLKLTKAGTSLYNDTKYIIQYCRDSVIRAKNAMQEDTNVIRIGVSIMTSAQFLFSIAWLKKPSLRFRIYTVKI